MDSSDLPQPETLDDAERDLAELTALCEGLVASLTDLVDAIEVLVLQECASLPPPLQA